MRTVLALLLMLPFPLSAQAPSPKAPVSSAENRANKDWQVTVGLNHLTPFLGPRLRGSLFLDGDSLLFAEIGGGTSDGFTDIYSNSLRSEARQGAVGLKVFLSNTFYAEGSGFFRTLKRDTNQYFNNIAFSSRAVGGAFVIGNQWQKNRFTLGCDWLGLHAPLAVFAERSQGDDDSEYFRRKKRDFKSFSDSMQLILPGFYLGFSF